MIPVLFWDYGSQRVHPPYTVIDLGLPSKVRPNTTSLNTFEPYRNWNYKKITVKPNLSLQNQNFYVSELKKLQAKNEKESGIEFIFNDDNSYQDLIALLDAMALSKQEAYCVDMEKTGHIFAIHFYIDPEKKIQPICGGSIGGEYYDQKTALNLMKPDTFVNEIPKQSYYLIFGFLIFLNISMLSIKERFQINSAFSS